MNLNDELKKIVGLSFKRCGFKRVSQKWVLEGEGCYLIFIFDWSRNSDSYYFRVCFWFPEIEPLPEKLPHSGGYHMSAELADIVTNAEDLELQFSNRGGYHAPADERVRIIGSLSDSVVSSLAENWSSVSLIKEKYFCGLLKKAGISFKVREYFGDTEWLENRVRPDGEITIHVPDE
ncbi:hypothetical protein [Chitinolyticbacter albus]|uniref:hypothetical protein n=1 Tax=Chitinolyticbacter albus TaxID=2961951 RepID=UPI00210C43C7|nr:hypothetical protein [Chitinolyticbacter albus]